MNCEQSWQRCLQIISENVSQHTFDVWFRDITISSYDPDKNAVVLEVPSTYVYEYIEELHVPLMKKALTAAFRPGVSLGYRLRKEPTAATPAVDFPAIGQIPQFSVPNARERLEKGLQHFLGDKARWLPCYDEVAKWLTDNKGRGLLCIGTPGLGKTLMCEKILPVILGRKIKTVTAREMAAQIDDILKERAVIVDDLGKEPGEYKNYGNVRKPFFELCDAAERHGILLIITTNLSTSRVVNPLYSSSIEERYGADVISRLRATVKVVEFKGDDLRN